MRAWVLAVVVIGCSGDTESSLPVPSPSVIPAVEEPAPVAPPDFPEGTRSLELRRTSPVRLAPGDDAKRIGTVAIDTRVSWVQTAKGRGCEKPWIEIRPRGWICGENIEPSKKPPLGLEVPRLERGELVPGVYGKVTAPSAMVYALEIPGARKEVRKDRERAERVRRDPRKVGKARDAKDAKDTKDAKGAKGAKDSRTAELRRRPITPRPIEAPAVPPGPPRMVERRPLVGSVNVRQWEEVVVGGRPYWKIDRREGEYVLRQVITQHRPSLFGGARLGDDTGRELPIGFVWPRFGARLALTTNTAVGGGVFRQLAARTALSILETAPDRTGKPAAYRIGEGEWIAAADVRVFQPAPPPPLLEPDERWIDIDLDAQILVAYEGELAVYATMVSTGANATPTQTGVYRMWLKESEADMNGLSGEDPYSVATVPWTQFFSPEDDLALHTAYWHDQFGRRLSHGCVNLAPRDARWLYFWSEPQVPPGWTMAAGMAEAPGSIVRVRHKDDLAPEHRGYAKKVLEARMQNAPIR
jgi:hypothetical protein